MSASAPTWRRCCGSISASGRGSACSPRSRSRWRRARVVGWLGFRFGVEGVYFALLTIASAEFTRIAFDHLGFAGGSGGLFLPYEERRLGEWWNLRGGQLLFYYLALVARGGRRRAGGAARALAARLSLACGARGRAGRPLARHRRVSRQDDRRAGLVRHDGGRRRVLRVLQQQPVSRADLRHRPLDRAAARADRRRARHGVRAGGRRLHPHPARRGADRADRRSSASTRPASRRCSTASPWW